MTRQMVWNSTLYDDKHGFVADYGRDLLDFIPGNKGLTILDLGCGTGTLTAQLSALGHQVTGIDSSPDMINKAKAQFSSIEFMVCDALALPFENKFDVVFSNAVFHWISDHKALLKSIYKILKPHGLLICEFGANGNIAAIEKAFAQACRGFGYDYESKFNFPTTESFGKLLTNSGFIIDQLYDYDRPTVLKEHEQGMANWLLQFFASELSVMPKHTQTMILAQVTDITQAKLWDGQSWVADYRRLRAIARK